MIKNELPHLLDIESLSASEIVALMDEADQFAHSLSKNKSTIDERCKDKVLINAFFEDSTRTRVSFEMAAHRLGLRVINWTAAGSSASKGEDLSDTLANLGAMGPDVLVMRHSEYKAPYTAASLLDCPVVNGGDGWRAHPSQALLDALTMRQAIGELKGKRIAICGDIAHSRVARSNLALLSKLGAEMHVIAPEALMPREKDLPEGVQCYDNLKDGLAGCDIVMCLRIQKERMAAGLMPDPNDFYAEFGLNYESMAYAEEGALVMHPGPMNRGVEINPVLADDPARSLILKQVKNGVAMRMAILKRALTGRKNGS